MGMGSMGSVHRQRSSVAGRPPPLLTAPCGCVVWVWVWVGGVQVRYYRPQLRGKALTAKLHGEVQQAFVERFGEYAGW